MANFKYFYDIDGEVIELTRIRYEGGSGKKASSWSGVTPDGERVRATRQVETWLSRRKCDARCMNASGRVMKCECSCGGKNHGRGRFRCSAQEQANSAPITAFDRYEASLGDDVTGVAFRDVDDL